MAPSDQTTRWRTWALAAAAFVAVSTLMLVPLETRGVGIGWPYFDKLVHCGMWLALALASWPALKASRPWPRAVRLLAVVAALSLWGAAVEGLQAFVPTRTPDAWDWLADTVGALVGALAMAAIEGSLASARPSTGIEALREGPKPAPDAEETRP